MDAGHTTRPGAVSTLRAGRSAGARLA